MEVGSWDPHLPRTHILALAPAPGTPSPPRPRPGISRGRLFQLGYSVLSRGSYVPPPPCRPLSLLHQSLQSLESVMKCVQMSWMVILVGPASVGKTSLVQLLAHLTGHTLKIMAVNSAMDTTELLGGFEQVTDQPRIFRQGSNWCVFCVGVAMAAVAVGSAGLTCSGNCRLILPGRGGSSLRRWRAQSGPW